MAIGTGRERMAGGRDEDHEAGDVDRVPQPARDPVHHQRRELHDQEELGGDDAPRERNGSVAARERDHDVEHAEAHEAVEQQGGDVQHRCEARHPGDEAVQIEHPRGAGCAQRATRVREPVEHRRTHETPRQQPAGAHHVPVEMLRIHGQLPPLVVVGVTTVVVVVGAGGAVVVVVARVVGGSVSRGPVVGGAPATDDGGVGPGTLPVVGASGAVAPGPGGRAVVVGAGPIGGNGTVS